MISKSHDHYLIISVVFLSIYLDDKFLSEQKLDRKTRKEIIPMESQLAFAQNYVNNNKKLLNS